MSEEEKYIKPGINPKVPQRSPEEVAEGVGPGWKKLVVDLCNDIRALGWDGHLLQIKEKFGGLRFYIAGATDDIWDRIGQAECLSTKICDECGEAGEPREGGWIVTRCDKHSEGREPLNDDEA